MAAECKHDGPCSGTCYMCDAEIKYLENELNEKVARGERIVLSGIELDCFDDFVDEEYEDEECDIRMGAPVPDDPRY